MEAGFKERLAGIDRKTFPAQTWLKIALTTSGHRFPHFASKLKEAGIDQVTISLDSLKKKDLHQ